jgi:hypothetical protein
VLMQIVGCCVGCTVCVPDTSILDFCLSDVSQFASVRTGESPYCCVVLIKY